MAKYRQIAESLRDEIIRGKYGVGDAFFSVTGLCRRFGVSRLTAVKVFDLLKEERLICSRNGSGTYVAERPHARKIGFIVPGLAFSEFYGPIVREMVRLSARLGFELLLGEAYSSDTRSCTREVADLAARFIASRVDGVIYQPLDLSPEGRLLNERILRAFVRAKMQVVLFDADVVEPPARSSYDVICLDNVAAGEAAADRLFESGAHEVCFVRGLKLLSNVQERIRGVAYSSVRHGRGWSEDRILSLDFQSPKSIVRELRAHAKADAFVCCSDTVAAKLLDGLHRLKRRVPEDVHIVGFDDVGLARLLSPSLTTVRQPCEALARAAVDRLFARLERPDLPPMTLRLPAELVVRESTRTSKVFPAFGKRGKKDNAAGKSRGE